MISEQRIIELASEQASDETQEYIGFRKFELIAFANALQSEWIKYQTGESLTRIDTLEQLLTLPLNTRLYALPNEEVK